MLVSVVVPAYNQAAYLQEALSSALAQTHRQLEIIVVDDGSTDQTRQVCAGFGDARIRYVAQDNDGTRGIGARNQAMLRATGDWIAPLDQDDRWHPTKVERQLALAEQRAQAGRPVGAVFTGVTFIDEHGKPTRTQALGEMPESNVFHLLLERNRYFVSSGMFRRELLGVSGLPHESCGLADWTLWLGVARHAEIAVVREHLADYREHSQGYQAMLVAGNRLRFAQDQHKTLLGQTSRLHPDCAKCRQIYRRGMVGVARLYLHSARRSLETRQWRGLRPSLRGAWSAAPGWLLSPWVWLPHGLRLLGCAVAGVVAPGRVR